MDATAQRGVCVNNMGPLLKMSRIVKTFNIALPEIRCEKLLITGNEKITDTEHVLSLSLSLSQ